MGILVSGNKYIDQCKYLLIKLEVLDPQSDKYREYYNQLEQAIHQGMKT